MHRVLKNPVNWAVAGLVLGVGYLVFFYGGHSAAPTLAQPGPAAAKMAWISHGEDVDLAAFASAEGLTVFEFTAPWCFSCRRLAPRLERLVASRDDVALRMIDIDDWESPVARRYRIRSVPQLMLFKDGEPYLSGTEPVLEALRAGDTGDDS